MKENGIEKLVGQRIKAAREAAGLSQAELAQKMGYKAASSITRAEKGRSDFPQSKIAAFAKALNVTPGFLLGDPLPVTLTGDTRRQVTPPDGARLAAILRQLQTDINKAIDAAVFAALHGDGYTASALLPHCTFSPSNRALMARIINCRWLSPASAAAVLSIAAPGFRSLMFNVS